MPVIRNLNPRRSRRLSGQTPRSYVESFVESDWEPCSDLLYPPPSRYSPSNASSSLATPPPTIPPLALHGLGSQFSEHFLTSIPAIAHLLAPFYPPASAPQTTAHGRKRNDDHISRPPNAFMIYRSHLWSERKVTSIVERDHRHISRIAGHNWQGFTEAERHPWKVLADWAKSRHAERYPGYKYAPQYRKEKSCKRRVARSGENDTERCKFISDLMTTEGLEGPALEEAVRRNDQRLAVAAADEAEEREVSLSLRSRRARRASRATPKVKTPTVKHEVSATPDPVIDPIIRTPVPLISDAPSSPYVSTDAIPPLDLDGVSTALVHTSDVKPEDQPMLYELNAQFLLPTSEPYQPGFTAEGLVGYPQPVFSNPFLSPAQKPLAPFDLLNDTLYPGMPSMTTGEITDPASSGASMGLDSLEPEEIDFDFWLHVPTMD